MPDFKFAAAYLRVSTDEQTEFSPDAQLGALREYAGRNNYAILEEHIYKDEGVSGRRAEKRPAFMRMIAAAKQKPSPFEAILVHKIDRFARSREDSVVYKSLLRRECGVKVISVTENIEDDKFSVILEAMLEAMAEYYSLNLSEEVKKGMTEKAKRGGLQSIPCFGYTVQDNVLVPIPEEAAWVREIFARFVAGDGFLTIAKWLNGLGVKTHRGNRFENRTVDYILHNPTYIGKLRWNPEGRTGRQDPDNDSRIVANGKHQPIIDDETWQAAQERAAQIKARWRPHRRPASEHCDWLSGLVRCAACGSSLVRVGERYWKCNAYAKGVCAYSQHIADERLKAMVLDSLSHETRNTYPLEYVALRTQDHHMRELLERQLSRLKKRLDRIHESYYGGADSLEEYKRAKQAVERECASVAITLQELSFSPEKDAEERRGIDDLLAVLQDESISMPKKHSAVHNAISSIVFDKETQSIEITYRLALMPK